MLLSQQASKIDLCFTRERHNNIDIIYIFQSYFHRPKYIICNNSNKIKLFKQTLTDITLLFRDKAGSGMNLQESKQICPMAWENEIDRITRIVGGKYTFRK